MKNSKNNKKRRATKLEKMLLLIVMAMVILTPITALTISTMNLMYLRDITKIENQISDIKQEVTELEVKKQEQLSWTQVDQYAAAGGLNKNEERVKRV